MTQKPIEKMYYAPLENLPPRLVNLLLYTDIAKDYLYVDSDQGRYFLFIKSENFGLADDEYQDVLKVEMEQGFIQRIVFQSDMTLASWKLWHTEAVRDWRKRPVINRDTAVGPAIIDFHPNSTKVRNILYCQNGETHRQVGVGPAIVRFDKDEKIIDTLYFENGMEPRTLVPSLDIAQFELSRDTFNVNQLKPKDGRLSICVWPDDNYGQHILSISLYKDLIGLFKTHYRKFIRI